MGLALTRRKACISLLTFVTFVGLPASLCLAEPSGGAGCTEAQERGGLLQLLEPAPATRRPPRNAWFWLGAPGRSRHAPLAMAVRDAIEQALGREPPCIRVVPLSAAELAARYRTMGGRGVVGLLGFHQTGLAVGSSVFVVKEPGGELRADVLLHEVLHALSERFTREAGGKHMSRMVEGITELLTEHLALETMGISRSDWDALATYPEEVAFARALEEAIGRARLTHAYLESGLGELEREVDGRLGGGTLRWAGRALQEGDLAAALQALRTAPSL